MGCDGGTIPKRGELVRTKKNPEKKDKESDLSFKWGHCSITQEPLQQPIVACQLGRLYNKTSVIEAILDNTKLPDMHKHIKSLKDVKELNLTDNKEYQKRLESKETKILNMSPYVCPVTGLEMNGKYRFVYFWDCGCTMSERALKAIGGNNCHKCQKPFIEDDIIILNGTNEDKAVLEKRMLERQAKIKAEKKLKKWNKSHNETARATATATRATTSTITSDNAKIDGPSSGQNVIENSLKHNGVKIEQNGNKLSKLPLKRGNNKGIEDPDFKRTCVDYSVAKDPKATEVFKSLFTTHKSAEKQTKAHWVTYNPFYN